MRILRFDRLEAFGRKYSDARAALQAWTALVQSVTWRNIQDVRRLYAHADAARVSSGRTVTIFNVKGNRYRLIVAIDYPLRVVNVLEFLTHAQYSKDRWKESL